MTKDEGLQLALDAMKEIIHWYAVRDRNDVLLNFVDQNPEIQKIMKSITAIKEALETKEGLLDRKSYLLGLYDQKSRLALETKDDLVALQYPQKDIDWQREQQIKAQGSTTPQPKQEQVEPVAWGMETDGLIYDVICPAEHEREEGGYTVPLYTTPQIETKDEPVAWMYWQSCLNDDGTQTSPWVQRYSKFKPSESVINKDITPLYTTPQPKQEAKDEPVAWRYDQAKYRTNDLRGRQWAFNVFLQTKPYIDEMVQNVTPLYTTPQRTWVGLTDEEMRELEKQFEAERVRTSDEEYLVIYPAAYWQWQRAIEAKLRSKNNV